jgi:GNAT superfamily N-acetyltransferase
MRTHGWSSASWRAVPAARSPRPGTRWAGWARERGAAKLHLEVEERNAPALALYAALGFEPRYR